MSDDTSLTAPATPPPVALLQMMTGYWVSQSIYVAAKLGLADLLADGPAGCEELAAATNSHAPALNRVLRALASVGVFTEATPGTLRAHPAGGPPSHRDARLDARPRHHVQRGAVPRLGRPPPQRADRRDRLRPPLRDGRLRLLRATPRGRSGLQRRDDRLDQSTHPRRARLIRLFPVRHRRRRWRRPRDAPCRHPAAPPRNRRASSSTCPTWSPAPRICS